MKLLIGIATAIVMTTAAHADPYSSYTIERNRYGGQSEITITRHRSDTGKEPPPMTRTYIHDSNGNLRDPVTGWPKGRNY